MRLYSSPAATAAAAGAALLLLIIPPSLQAVDLDKIQRITSSSASEDFENQSAYAAAVHWHTERLLRDVNAGSRAPFIMCADYREGRKALASLEDAFSRSEIHSVANSEADGSCFIVTASPVAAAALMNSPERFSLLSAAPFLPSLKLAPGLLDHGVDNPSRQGSVDDPDVADRSARLRSTYGESISLESVVGLNVKLSPGILPVVPKSFASAFVHDWHSHIMSEGVTISTTSFWSDPGADRSVHEKTRVREWTRAAAVVDDLASKHSQPVGEICKLKSLRMHLASDDLIVVQGLDHLLPNEKNPSEAKMACFMGLLSQLAAKPEVLRISPLHRVRNLNAVASAVVQSATITDTPLLDAGLDGTGEVIQIVDTGLDETSCYFADDDGGQVEHGFLYLGGVLEADGNISFVLGNDSFTYDMSRRKVVQYIEQFKKSAGEGEDEQQDESFMYASDYLGNPYEHDDTEYEYYTYDDESEIYITEAWNADSFCGEILDDLPYYFSFLFDDESYSTSSTSSFTGGFYKDTVGGHGTWTAGSAAGSIPPRGMYTEATCCGDELPGCAGGCIPASDVGSMLENGVFNFDLYCPMYNCDGTTDLALSYCLSDDPVETLNEHSGVAPGAKISMFDYSYTGSDGYVILAGNLVWESAMSAGAKLHSNSWGYTTLCQASELDLLFDVFMHENPENLLIFAAGNDGGFRDIPGRDSSCTIGSPGLGKNVLTVGATSSGPARGTDTGSDGRLMYERLGITDYSPEGFPWVCLLPLIGYPMPTAPSSSVDQADIDTIAWFSSYGPTLDSRIKPEVVAPGDKVASAWSDGTDDPGCRLVAGGGTSAACPLVAGSAALVRQYFTDSAFFAEDVSARGVCGTGNSTAFQCDAFAPSAATVKAMIINSANLMGGSSEPDGFRGFGRVHLEAGMPMNGSGEMGLLVVDSSEATIGSYGENTVVVSVDGDAAGVDLRATLCWIDPPATSVSAIQLLHDLDLVVQAPSGATYTMWMSGAVDTVNVIERVIVPAESMESGEWNVIVSSKGLLSNEQAYSLVVTGPIYSTKK